MAGTGSRKDFMHVIKRFLSGNASDDEKEFITKYYDYFDHEEGIVHSLSDEERKALEEEMLQVISVRNVTGGQRRVIFMRPWAKWVAAALIITGAVWWNNRRQESALAGQSVARRQESVDSIHAGGNRALLTLGDGKEIVLDSAADGRLASQGTVKIIKLNNGLLSYNGNGLDTATVVYNTITTPRGGQYRLVLADGTGVWLNAASSLRFPVNFTGKERLVTLTGEAYFEVAKNAAMPFIVKVEGRGEVEVTGTHFNVNAYEDAERLLATLVEGKIRLHPADPLFNSVKSLLLSPGQQAGIDHAGKLAMRDNPDIDEVLAWKNGKFIFNGSRIQEIMKQVEKWYDVKVEYTGRDTDEEFFGVISRSVSITQILAMLEKTRAVTFEVNGKKIIVKQ